MAIIAQYNIADLIDGGAAIAVVVQPYSGSMFDRADGLVHDDTNKFYNIIGIVGNDSITRISADLLTVELSITPSAAPDNFLNPTFATIISSVPTPGLSALGVFGHIIW